jgi:hypothetical protein
VGRRSSSAPPTRKRVPGVGYEVEGDGDENESALGAEANGLGPSPFSAFLGGGVKKKEKLKKSDAVVANGKSIDGKGQRKRGDEVRAVGNLLFRISNNNCAFYSPTYRENYQHLPSQHTQIPPATPTRWHTRSMNSIPCRHFLLYMHIRTVNAQSKMRLTKRTETRW